MQTKIKASVSPASPSTLRGGGDKGAGNTKLIGWQGFTFDVPETWDLTGFSGNESAGYVRVDDSEEQAVEVKWATEPPKTKTEPDVEARRDKFIASLRQTARKKKLSLEASDVASYRPVERDDRAVAPFVWQADRKAYGSVWFCRTCRRVVIAQVLGAPSGRNRLSSVAESVLASIRCHGSDPAWRTWALYDLRAEVSSEYSLESQQLMNVYLRLSFVTKKASRLTIEQWALANVARKDSYLDTWLSSNTKGDMNDAKYDVTEIEMHGHPAIRLQGRLALGFGVSRAVQQAARFQRPALRYSGVAWQCDTSNKLYFVQGFRTGNAADVTEEIGHRTLCHTGESERTKTEIAG